MNTAVAKTFRNPKVITHVKCSASLNHADNINKHFPLLAEAVDAKTVISLKCKHSEQCSYSKTHSSVFSRWNSMEMCCDWQNAKQTIGGMG